MKIWITLCGTALLAAVGCTNVNSVQRAQPLGQQQVVNDKRVEPDSDVSSFAQVMGVNESAVGDLTKIQVRVFNNKRKMKQFNYKFEWFDLQGMSVDSPMSIWKAVTIQAQEEISLIAIAPNPRAKDFRLKMQQAYAK